ncbi:MAG: hypothetical protein VX681_00490 [Myxococcota bacterium]|nr:hypothetical protein [Myxococcota bacterium]
MASGPTRRLFRDRLATVRAGLRSRALAASRGLAARPWLRIPLGLGFVVAAPALAAYARSDPAAAETAARLALSFAALAWLGRGLRLAWERAFGASRFAVWREPAWDGLVGWLFALVTLLLFSLIWKRGVASVEPVGWLVPAGWVALAAVLSLPRSLRRAAAPTGRDFARLGGFLAGFAWLAGGHLGVRRPYSSDPEQHIAWLTQLQSHGFVPDFYWQTDVPITYPMGFAALAHSLGALSGLAAPALIALLPPFVSVLFVYLIVVAARDLVGPREPRPSDAVLFALVVLAAASAFDSAQFSAWNVYEGTGRLGSGALHAVPVIAGLAVARGAVALRAPGGAARGAVGGLLVFAAAVTTALVALLNPSHLPLQVVLWAVVLAAAALRASRSPGSGGAPGILLGALAGAVLALALLAADGVTARRVLGIGEVDPSLAHVEAEFDAGLAGETCWEPGCIASAVLRPAVLAALATPARVLVEGPVRALVAPAYDRFSEPLLRGPRLFPDLTGSGLAPLHGLARLATLPLPLLLALVLWRSGAWRSAWALALAGLLVAASLESAVREALRTWVDPDDAALRLLPSYASRAAAVVFAQSFWPLLAAGLVFRVRSGRVLAGCGAVLVLVVASAQSELGERRAKLERWRSGPGAREVADLRALEAEHVPRGEHYLVSSHIAVSNRERWLVPIDFSSPLYVQAARPALFLYHLSSGARVAAAEFEATCRRIRPGEPTQLLAAHRARWVALLAPDEAAARRAFGTRRFCGRPLSQLFPDARLAGRRGRVALFRLW